ncbi:desmoplakin-like [Teleopsis dalmanni]|uniref:desmoplakin-like n=1 Tax=Teleopsis dalmanni TaxID=139649 RepID=UPI0018CFC015|nr:desmoplakin-like [Teleopsis dalmanni]
MATQKSKGKCVDNAFENRYKPANRKEGFTNSKYVAPVPVTKDKSIKSSSSGKKSQSPKVPFVSRIRMPSVSDPRGKHVSNGSKTNLPEVSADKSVKSGSKIVVGNLKTNSQTNEIGVKLRKSSDAIVSTTMTKDNECIKNQYNIAAFLQKRSLSDIDISHQKSVLEDRKTQSAVAIISNDHSLVKNYPPTTYAECHLNRQYAAMKIYSVLLFNVWQKKLREVDHFTEKLEAIKKSYIGCKNQKLVVSTMLRMEQKRNQKIRQKLDESTELLRTTNESCKFLQSTINSINTEKKVLEQEIKNKDNQYDDLQTTIALVESELTKAISEQADLRIKFNAEKFQSEMLTKQVNNLVGVIYKLNQQRRVVVNELYMVLALKNQQFLNMEAEVESLQSLYDKLKLKEHDIKKYQEEEEVLKKECEGLRLEIINLENSLKDTYVQRFKHFLSGKFGNNFGITALQILGFAAFAVWPVAPPPFIFPCPSFVEKEQCNCGVKEY